MHRKLYGAAVLLFCLAAVALMCLVYSGGQTEQVFEGTLVRARQTVLA